MDRSNLFIYLCSAILALNCGRMEWILGDYCKKEDPPQRPKTHTVYSWPPNTLSGNPLLRTLSLFDELRMHVKVKPQYTILSKIIPRQTPRQEEHSGQTLGMRKWILFCQLCANFTPKNLKENVGNNRCRAEKIRKK